ncbi:MAG: large conductance mechanosensitive channel protein MscL [Mycobacteriales bacterium]|nr:large conductance mechanosensitive channel protein MscL [Mycobacteriales bacterium]
MDGFKKFLLRGNVVDLAVGVVIGAAFGAVVTAFTTGLLTPLIGLFGNKSFDQYQACLKGACTIADDGTVDGVLLRYGAVLTALLNFVIVAAVIYFFVVKPIGRLMDKFKTEPEPSDPVKECAECLSKIPVAATRCAFCTVEQLEAVG